MGQYYLVILLADEKDGNGHEIIRQAFYPGSSKLMEHSYLDERSIQSFEFLLSPEGLHYKSRLVWAGDYADHELVIF